MVKLREVDEEKLSRLKGETGLPEAILRFLLLRGIEDKEEIRVFLFPTRRDFYPSALLPDIGPAIERIKKAIRDKERILIWGHEDVDGITATVLLESVLKDLRAEVFHFIPKKHEFKYGIYPPKVFSTEEWEGVRLLIAVDCGTTNHSEVKELKSKGIETIIIDHHEAVKDLPEAVAVINPKINKSLYPFRELAGVGVVFKFSSALIEEFLGAKIEEWTEAKPCALPLAYLGTISDRVPLIQENRIIAREGARDLKKKQVIPAWQMMSNLEEINGMLSLLSAIEGQTACDFFLTKSEEVAREIFDRMVERQEGLKKEMEEAFLLAESVKSIFPGLVVVKSIFLPLRSLSYIANRFKERYSLPVIVMGKKENDLWVAECRGTKEIDLLDLLQESAPLFLDWGGHKKACGFSIKEENLEEFMKRAREYAEREFLPKIKEMTSNQEEVIFVDGILTLSEIPKEVFLLPPFGEGNPPPLFFSPDTEVKEEWRQDLFREEASRIIPGKRYDLLWTVEEKGIKIKSFLPREE